MNFGIYCSLHHVLILSFKLKKKICTFYIDIHSLKYFQSIYHSCCKVRTRFVTCKLGDCRVWTLTNPINSKPTHNSGGGVGIRTDSWCHQINCWHLPRLIWEGEAETVLYKLTPTYLITAAWPSGYIAAPMHVTPAEAMVQSLLMYFFYIVIVTRANIGICWNLLESIWIPLKYGNSNGFQHIPTDSNGNHSRRLLDSNWFCQILLDSVGNSMEWKTKMAEASAKWILLEFHGIPTFWLESGGFRWNSGGRVKTSNYHILYVSDWSVH